MPVQPERLATAERYYRVTADSFRALCPEASGHMNMGLWPARSLREAQEALIRLALDRAKAVIPRPRCVLDLGSGWGGARALFHAAFPGSRYVGVNVSEAQVAVARAANAAIPRTTYVVGRVEDPGTIPWAEVDAVLSIEAAFHFEDKGAIARAAGAHGVRAVTLLEITIEEAEVARDPLLAPSLGKAWSVAQWRSALAGAGLDVRVQDVGERVFPGFLAYLDAIDDATYRGRRAVLDQLRRATRAIASAAARGAIRYVVIEAAKG